MYLTTRPCSGLILTSYNRVDAASSIDDKLSAAINKYNYQKEKFIIRKQDLIKNNDGIKLTIGKLLRFYCCRL